MIPGLNKNGPKQYFIVNQSGAVTAPFPETESG